MPQKQIFLSYAQSALARYHLRQPAIHFLGHSDNLTFRVEEPGGAVYLLRIHQPVLNYWEGMRQLPEAIGSELAWLEALALEGGFNVQRPVRTSDGSLVAMIEMDGTGPVPCTLLGWLEGQHFSPAEADAAQQVEQFGVLAARMHDFSVRWTPPEGFIRPRYDLNHFRRIFARLLRGVDLGVFSEDVYWTLRATTQAIISEIEALPESPEHWGMIHADLHVGNFLVSRPDEGTGFEIIPIDFSFCGMGHYLFDISVCLAGGLNADLRPHFLSGYRSVRPLMQSDMRPIEAYMLSGRFSYYGYQIDNPAERAWLQRRLPETAKNECSKFLQGESIL